MAKRSWNEANQNSSPSSLDNNNNNNNASNRPRQRSRISSTSALSPGNLPRGNNDTTTLQSIPTISRKVKACAACRKQKVRCHMDDGPPCLRCSEKDLSCVLNKSLQTLIDERLPSSDALVQDLEMVYSNVQTILRTLNLPAQGPLQSSKVNTIHTPTSVELIDQPFIDQVGPSCDNSPKLSPEDDHDLPKVPIQSVYHLTKLKSLRSPESSHNLPPPIQDPLSSSSSSSSTITTDDFISRGLLPLSNAEHLFTLYTHRLDHYIYNVGARYSSLQTLRSKSPLLTAAILTVAAQHDPHSNSIYPICSLELRRLIASSLFDRRVDKDHLRALCVASYWLNDSSWVLSGLASRRAASFNIASQFNRLVTDKDGGGDANGEAADFVRIWYLIYICDQHLSTLYGRECTTTREDAALQNWEMMIKALPSCGDRRLASQVALLTIIHSIRELFGSDADKPIPLVFLSHIKSFARQLDQWIAYWSTILPEYQEGIGLFPRRGASFHFQFAKLYLYSHVFRGLSSSSSSSTPHLPPPAFLPAAHAAVSAAVCILNMLLTDQVLQDNIIGLPAYLQSMIAFACMFLARLATTTPNTSSTTIHGVVDVVMIETETAVDLISRLVVLYRGTLVGKWHLIPHMADGLDKILRALQRTTEVKNEQSSVNHGGNDANHSGHANSHDTNNVLSMETPFNVAQMDLGMMNLDPSFLMNPNLSLGMGMGTPEHPFYGDEFGFGSGTGMI